MKPGQHTISSELKTTAPDVVRWAMELCHLHARMAPYFARPEPRQRCLLYLQGMDGVLSFTPDSLQWFNRLASLTSFRFIGLQGRFTAYREGQTGSWKAYRSDHRLLSQAFSWHDRSPDHGSPGTNRCLTASSDDLAPIT